MRLRLYFDKTEAMRYTGHLDLHHTWERVFRRAQLPLAYSQGFHPQPRINLACALPLGFTSHAEVLDFWLETDLPLADVEAALLSALPPGIRLNRLEEVDLRSPALQTIVLTSTYEITLLDPMPELDERLAALLAADTLPRERRGKPYDLRVLIESLERITDDESGQARLRVCLAARASATGRPEELMTALGVDPFSARYHRTALALAQPTEPTPVYT